MNLQPERKPLLATLPALMFAAGLGMAMYYGYSWWRLPHYSAEDIAQSVELNMAIDLQRRGQSLSTDAAQIERLREQVHAEVVAAIDKDRYEAQRYFGIGLVMMVLGLVQMILLRRMAAR